MEPRLLIVSNRLPVTVHLEDGEPVVRKSVGGLATGLRIPHERSGGLWIGWPGNLDELDGASLAAARRRLEELRTVPVALDANETSVFYEHISNEVLWPICHDRTDQLPHQIEGWDVYESVNARYADAVAERYRPGDLIWVHDYQLMRVPVLLRERLPDARIGFFLHTPFPNPEIFFTLPTRAWLVEGMMGADLVGFHVRQYHGHFRAALRRLFSLEADARGGVGWRDRRVRLGVFPMGVDAADFAARAASPSVSANVLEYKDPRQRLLVSVDRMDYSKGFLRRLLAIQRLLEICPEWREGVRLIQVAVPSRDRIGAYQRLRADVDAAVGQINGKFATPSWAPIHYMYRSVPDEMLLALYRAADVMVVTPTRDGMNLVAKEFAACRADEDGVLVLSEFAGAADQLTDALLVNPYDVDGVARTIHRALTMNDAERRRRMRALRAVVFEHDVHWWATSFLDQLSAGA